MKGMVISTRSCRGGGIPLQSGKINCRKNGENSNNLYYIRKELHGLVYRGENSVFTLKKESHPSSGRKKNKRCKKD